MRATIYSFCPPIIYIYIYIYIRKSGVTRGKAGVAFSRDHFSGRVISLYWIVFGTITLTLVSSVRNKVVSPDLLHFVLRKLEVIEFITLYWTL